MTDWSRLEGEGGPGEKLRGERGQFVGYIPGGRGFGEAGGGGIHKPWIPWAGEQVGATSRGKGAAFHLRRATLCLITRGKKEKGCRQLLQLQG